MRKIRAASIGLLAGFIIGASGASYFLYSYGYLIGLERVTDNDLIPHENPNPNAPSPPPLAPWPETPVPPQMAQTQPQTREGTQASRVHKTPPETDQLAQWKKLWAKLEDLAAFPMDPSTHAGPMRDSLARDGTVIAVPSLSPDVTANAIAELRSRDLALPVKDLKKQDLHDSFKESRGNHIHEAIDILASRNTPILAVDDGTIARLWYSVPGGITIYQFDRDKKYEYYYAHLERYAEGLKEGDHVKRCQIIGYVGTSGNAPKNTPHLHFTIYKLTQDKHWWEGTPINPYLVLK